MNCTFLGRERRILNYWIMWLRLQQEASADGALAGRSKSCLKSYPIYIFNCTKHEILNHQNWLLPFIHLWEIHFGQLFSVFFKHPTRCLEKEKEVFPLLLSIGLHIPLRLNYLICEVLFSFVRLLCVFYTTAVWSISTFKLSKVFYFNYLTSPSLKTSLW